MFVDEAILIAVIVGLSQLAKELGVKDKFIPILAILLGIAGGTLYLYTGDIKSGVMSGIIMGLSSVGLYSGSKNIFELTFNQNNKKEQPKTNHNDIETKEEI